MRNCHFQNEEKLCFVQYLEDLSREKRKLDEIQKILGCVFLQWHRTSGEPGKFSAQKEYEFDLVVAVCGAANLAPKSTKNCAINPAKLRTVSDFHIYDGIDRYKNLSIEVKRFLIDNIDGFEWRERCSWAVQTWAQCQISK